MSTWGCWEGGSLYYETKAVLDASMISGGVLYFLFVRKLKEQVALGVFF